MKCYVTARSSRFDEAKELFTHLKALGHEITFEWTELPMVKPYSEHQADAAKFAQQGIQGVVDADVYIKFQHEDGNGVFTEFGAALASNMMKGTPRICVIGDRLLDHVMFYAHPSIEWYGSVEALLAELGVEK